MSRNAFTWIPLQDIKDFQICHPAPPGHFHFWKKSRICKSGHVATWSAGDQSQQVRRESASGLIAHYPLLMRSTTLTRMMMTAIVTVRHRLGLGWLRHLSFIVVSCISWHLAVVIDCKSQPPLKIISHKILGRVGRDGGTAVSETSAWCVLHLYCLVRRTLMLAWLHILPTIQYMQLCTREANIGLSDGHLSHQASVGCSTFMFGWKYKDHHESWP